MSEPMVCETCGSELDRLIEGEEWWHIAHPPDLPDVANIAYVAEHQTVAVPA